MSPQRAELTGNWGQTREVDLSRGAATFAPMETRRLVIRFEAAAIGAPPVGVAELEVANLEDQVHRTDRQLRTGAVCGLGPEVEVDGRVYPTEVTGTIGAVLDGTPLTLTGCGTPVRLSSGTHLVRIRATDQYTATRLTMLPSTSEARAGGEPGSVDHRDVAVRSWTTGRRVVDVAPGPAALLVLPENVNAGWRATLGGDELTPVRVDGWMQGYVIPEGDGGRVTLDFTPNRLYQGGLALGGLLRSCSWQPPCWRGAANGVPRRCENADRLRPRAGGPGDGACRPWPSRSSWEVRRSRPGCWWETSVAAGSVTPGQSELCWWPLRRWPRRSWRASRRLGRACPRRGATCSRGWASDSLPPCS